MVKRWLRWPLEDSYGAHKLLLNAYGLDKDATMAFVNVMQEKIGK